MAEVTFGAKADAVDWDLVNGIDVEAIQTVRNPARPTPCPPMCSRRPLRVPSRAPPHAQAGCAAQRPRGAYAGPGR